MTADSHQPDTAAYGDIPVEWHPVLLDYVLWQAAQLAKDEVSQGGAMYEQRWARGLVRAKQRQAFKLGRPKPRASAGYRDRGLRNIFTPGIDQGV